MSIFFKFFAIFWQILKKNSRISPLFPQKRVKKQGKIREFLRKNTEFLIKK